MADEQVMVVRGIFAEGDEVALVQFQIRSSEQDDVVEWEFVVDFDARGISADGAFGMFGEVFFPRLVPKRAAGDAELFLNGCAGAL